MLMMIFLLTVRHGISVLLNNDYWKLHNFYNVLCSILIDVMTVQLVFKMSWQIFMEKTLKSSLRKLN